MEREVLVNRNSTKSKNNTQSDNIVVPNKSFKQMAATDGIISQPESIIKISSRYK